jgi:hypothetical protein
MFTLGHTKFLVEINYKSGIQKRFWVYSFSLSDKRIRWNYCLQANKPIDIYCTETQAESIESIWQVGCRLGLLGVKK